MDVMLNCINRYVYKFWSNKYHWYIFFGYIVLCAHKKYSINLQCSSVSILIAPEEFRVLSSESAISSLEIAFLKAVMLPPEIARFCVAVFFSNVASAKSSVNQPNRIRSVLWSEVCFSITFKLITVCPRQI